MKGKNIGSILMLILAAAIWGGSFAVIKDSLDYVTPLWQLALRLAVASVGGMVIFPLQLKHIRKKYIFQGVVLGVIFAAALIPQNYGASLTTASKCAFLTVSYVAFTPLLCALFCKERLTPKKVLTVIICMTGVGLITLNEGLVLQKGDIFLIITGIAYAGHITWIEKNADAENSLIMHIVQIWTAALISLAAALIAEPFSISYEGDFVFSIIYCGIFEVLVGFLLQIKGQQNTSPSLAGIILSMECVFAAVFGIAFMGDTFTFKAALGCILIFISAILESVNLKGVLYNGLKA